MRVGQQNSLQAVDKKQVISLKWPYACMYVLIVLMYIPNYVHAEYVIVCIPIMHACALNI